MNVRPGAAVEQGLPRQAVDADRVELLRDVSSGNLISIFVLVFLALFLALLLLVQLP